MSTLPNNHRPATAEAGYHETRMMSQGMYMWGQDVHIKEETDKQQLTLVAHSSIGNIRLVKREWKEDGKNRLVISSIISHQQAETGAYWYHCRWCRRLRIHPVTSRRNQYHRLEFRAISCSKWFNAIPIAYLAGAMEPSGYVGTLSVQIIQIKVSTMMQNQKSTYTHRTYVSISMTVVQIGISTFIDVYSWWCLIYMKPMVLQVSTW